MIASWFNTPERIALLEFKAAKWLGTPWFPNSNTPGKGVSCQKLVSAIYREVGFADVPVPETRMSARALKESLVEAFMGERPEFERIGLDEERLPGDLLGFNSYSVIHHLGIVMAGTLFVHVAFRGCVMYSSLADATYGSALRAIWRPRRDF
jgi:cell wall-associated NlpC family hydrolase